MIGLTFILIGTISIIVYFKQSKKGTNPIFEKPYFKNAGISFILFGIYYLASYFFKL